MRETNTFACGDVEALVTYLYDECDPDQRAAIEEHAALCASCADELVSLRATRSRLTAWTPPSVDLGFQITGGHRPPVDDVEGGRVLAAPTILRPAKWWSRPLPAWAQAAAAAAIFTSGLAIGTAHRGSVAVAAAPAPTVAPTTVAAVSTPSGISQQDLDALESRLRGEISRVRTTAAPAAAVSGGDDVLRQVRALIAESEQRQQRATALRTAQMVGQLEEQRRVDLAQIQRTVGEIQRLTGVAFQDQNRLLKYYVSQQR
jgi:Putative zinc-finger